MFIFDVIGIIALLISIFGAIRENNGARHSLIQGTY